MKIQNYNLIINVIIISNINIKDTIYTIIFGIFFTVLSNIGLNNKNRILAINHIKDISKQIYFPILNFLSV